jgi:hypothetical protein
MRSKKYRVQRDSLKAINLSVALFVKLLTKTCEVVQSSSTLSSGPKRAANTIDVDHLAIAVKRYEVLAFMQDLVDEMKQRPRATVLTELNDEVAREEEFTAGKRKTAPEELVNEEGAKKQRSITSFFKPN